MCTNGVNNAQLIQMIQQLDDHIALERRWVHKIAHTAEDGGYEAAHEKLHEAQHLLDSVRALIDAHSLGAMAQISEDSVRGIDAMFE